jgi:hypothetical protein
VNARFLSTAERELREAIEFYESSENGLGTRFLDEIEAAVARIVANPTGIIGFFFSRFRSTRVNCIAL